jgi:integrase
MIYKRGNVYWFQFVYNGVRYRGSTGLTHKAGAMRVEARKKTEIIMGKTRKEAPDFSKFVEEFLTWSQAQNKASTHKRYRVSSKPLLKYFRGKVSEIDMASVERFKVSRLKECSPAGVNRDLAALRYMMNFAIRQGYIESNPVRVKFLQEGPGEMRILSHDEERLYLDNSPQLLKDIAIVILQTGMRPNEVYSMRKEDVHPGFIFVPKGKTRFARRNIPLTAEAAEVLERRAKEAKGACLFPSRLNPDKPMTITRSHLTVCRKIGLEFRLYDLRHTFGSRAAMAGVDLPTLKELMGHSSITLTMRYVHPTPAHKVEAIQKLRMFNGHNSGHIEKVEAVSYR